MVNEFENVVPNINKFYMAGLMTAPMVVISLLVMRSMYPDRKVNLVILGVSVVALVGFWFAIREQAAVEDRALMRSMIPHHASAILMCEEASLENPRVQELCRQIVASQREEIRLMKALLAEPDH